MDTEFRSHPDKLLIQHLREVGENARSLAPQHLKEPAYIAGSLHDIGKYTSFFQKHLREGKRVACSDHASVSALLAFDASKRAGLDDLTSYQVMTAVKSHHGALKGVEKMDSWLSNLKHQKDVEAYQCLEKQLNEVKKNAQEALTLGNHLSLDVNVDTLVKQAWKTTLQIMDNRGSANSSNKPNSIFRDFYRGELLFSCLIDADKHSASGTQFTGTTILDPSKVDEFHDLIKSSSNSPMSSLREKLYNTVRGMDPSHRIVGVISPTGTGKTLSGIRMATSLASPDRRVIYSLPFISIVEQNYEVAHRIFGDNVLKFHHIALGDLPTKSGGSDVKEEERSAEDSLMVAESWDYPFVVTTFESFLTTFLSHRNLNLRRLHSIEHSVVILDEVQAIPVEKWNLVWTALKELSEEMDVHFILMTATMPSFLTPDYVLDPLKEESLNRVRVEVKEEPVTPEELAQEVLGDASEPVMVELNTITSAERVADSLKGKVEVEFLSTHVTHYDRAERIERMRKRLERGERFVLVTTQVVEAGVDVDFPVVYRDLGPLDSVIQAAGRCNRNSKLEKGKVKVRRVKRDGRNETDFALVYGKVTEDVTLEVLGRKGWTFEERDFRDLLDSYYKEVERRRNVSGHSQKTMDEVRRLNYDLINFSLVDKEPKYTVLVLENEEAEERYRKLKEAFELKGYERRNEVKKWRARAEEFMVNVWDKPDLEYDERLEVYIADKGSYDELKGFKVKGNDDALIW